MINRFSPSLRLAVTYLFVSTVWIIGSDYLLEKITANNHLLLNEIQSIKGILFVCCCSVFLYFLSRKLYRDIQQSLKKSDDLLHKYSALSEATKEGIIDYDVVNDEAIINEQFRIFLGLNAVIVPNFSREQKRRLHKEDEERINQSFTKALNSNATMWQAEYRYLWSDNQYHDVISRGYIIRDKGGKALRFICTVQDVTELHNIKASYYEQKLKHKQQLGKSIIKAQEHERNRWAEELHDNVCQMLAVVKLYLSELSAGRGSAPDVLSKSQSLVVKAMNEIRQLSASIKPPEFSAFTLEESIKSLADNINRFKPFKFKFCCEHLQEDLLRNDHKLMIYRVVQEQLNNITKYANPSTIIIELRNEEDLVQIKIADDGDGFDTEKVKTGIGLRNIQSRLQIFKGNMKIISAPGEGCVLWAEFSLN